MSEQTPQGFFNPLQQRILAPDAVERKDLDAWTYDQKYKKCQEEILRKLQLNLGIKCEKHGPSPWAFGCRHVSVLTHDMQHPEGAVFTKDRWYLCRTCFKLFERKKLNLETELGMVCYACVRDFGIELRKINPELAVDLS